MTHLSALSACSRDWLIMHHRVSRITRI